MRDRDPKREWANHLRPRLDGLRLTPAREAEIVDELSQHLEERYEELRVAGSSDADARRLALEELSEPDVLGQHMAALRQAHVAPPIAPGTPSRRPLRGLFQDLRYAARMLAEQPGFAAAGILTLALGIGANTAIFSLINATLLQRLPVADRERLVYVYRGGVGGALSYPLYANLRDSNELFDGFAAWGGITASLRAGDTAELVNGVIVTGNFFDVLGVKPAHGRLLNVADDVTPGAHPVAVVGHAYWHARFAGDPLVVGREIRLNGQVFTIVGVAPGGFPGPEIGSMRNLYVPMMMQAIMRPPRAGYSGELNPDLLNSPTNSWLFGVGRLKPGLDPEQARATLDTLATTFGRSLPRPAPARIAVIPLDLGDPTQRQRMESVALLLGAIVGAVLLIACANIANLLLSRMASRRREIAVRLALGASRGRLVRQLLTESVLLSLMGGVTGVALAWAALEAFQATPLPPGAPAIDLVIDQRVLLFSLALSCTTGIVFGLAPAWRASRPSLVPALKDGTASVDDRGQRFNLKNALVVAEVALSLFLLIAAGLFVRSLHAAQAIDPGFDAEKLVNAPLNINLLRYTRAQGREFYRQVIERVERLPGVESASVARVALLTGGSRVLSLHVEGRVASHGRTLSEGGGVTAGDTTTINANVIGPRFFDTLGIPLVRGRDFGGEDIEEGPAVVVINEAAARTHFSGEIPVGKRVSVDGPQGPWREIIGVVRDAKYRTVGEGALPIAYLPLAQNHETGMTLYVRASGSPESLIGSVRAEIKALEPNLPVPDIAPVTQTIGASLYPARMGAWLIGVFGGLALLLAAVGIYGVLAFSIARRTREMGIRLALGAETGNVFRLVVGDGMRLVAIGSAIGLLGGLLGARALASFLYGLPTSDVTTFAASIVILGTVALIACVIPARRAMRVNPLTALRYE